MKYKPAPKKLSYARRTTKSIKPSKARQIKPKAPKREVKRKREMARMTRPPVASKEPEPEPIKPEPIIEQLEQPIVPEPPQPQPAPPAPQPPQPKPPVAIAIRELTDAQRKKAKLVRVPDDGPIPTPYINWNNIPPRCRITDINHIDYPIPGAPHGLLKELRNQFRNNRLYQDVLPPNVWISGPPGTGKSQIVKKFAEDTGLPYWGVIGRQGIRADELLGHWEVQEGGKTVWIEGIIPKAVKAGGILHFDEPNVIEPSTLMRLDELMDNKRQLFLEETGELIKAHPDLFIIFTSNPPTFEGVKDLPDPIKSRLIKKYQLDYPPQETEYKIIESKLRIMGVKPNEFSVTAAGKPTGRYAKDISDFMTFIQGLRQYQKTGETLSYTPTTRETIGFVQDLRAGKDFFTAVDTNVMSVYYDPEEAHKVEEALGGVRRR